MFATLRLIREVFENEDFSPLPNYEGTAEGERRSLVAGYHAAIDFSDPGQVARLVRVYADALDSWGRDNQTGGFVTYGQELIRSLQRDDVPISDEGIVTGPLTAVSLSRPLEDFHRLGDPLVVQQHLERIAANVDSDPPAAIASSKELVESAIESASTDLIDVVDEHREEWDADAYAQLQDAQAGYAEAIESAAAAARTVFEKLAVLRWVRLFPEVLFYSVGDGKVPGLMAPNGELFATGAVFNGLREQAQIEWNPQLPRDPHGAATQALHEERRANELAHGYYMTDAEHALYVADPMRFFGGQDAKLMSKMSVPLLITGNEEDSE